MKNKNIFLLLSGQLVSQTGDKFYMLALSLMVYETTGSAAKMGVVLFAGMLPLVTAGLFAGVVVDMFSRKKIIIITDILRGVIVSAVSILYFYDSLSFTMIILSQILLGVNSAFFNPVIPAVIPEIVESQDLSRTNAKTQFIAGFSNIAGPALGGFLVAVYGYFIVFVCNAVSYFVSALFESFLQLPSTQKDSDQKIGSSFRKGYSYIYEDKKLLIIIFMVFIIHFFVGSIEVSIPVIAKSLPGEGAINMGYLQTTFGVGALVMATLLSYISLSGRESLMLFVAVSCIGLALMIIGMLGLLPAHIFYLLICFFLLSSCLILAATSFQSLIQKSTDSSMTGRVFSVVSSVGNFSIPFAMLIYGFLLEYINCYILLLLSGAVILVVTLFSSRFYGNQKRVLEIQA